MFDGAGGAAVDFRLDVFNVSPAGTSDSGAYSALTLAAKKTAEMVAQIDFVAGNFHDGVCIGTMNGGPFQFDYFPSGTALYGLLHFLGTAKASAAGSYAIALNVQKN